MGFGEKRAILEKKYKVVNKLFPKFDKTIPANEGIVPHNLEMAVLGWGPAALKDREGTDLKRLRTTRPSENKRGRVPT